MEAIIEWFSGLSEAWQIFIAGVIITVIGFLIKHYFFNESRKNKKLEQRLDDLEKKR